MLTPSPIPALGHHTACQFEFTGEYLQQEARPPTQAEGKCPPEERQRSARLCGAWLGLGPLLAVFCCYPLRCALPTYRAPPGCPFRACR